MTKIQKSWYADKELSDRLRIEAAKRNVKQNDIVETAVRKELGMKAKQISDRGGDIHKPKEETNHG